MVRERTDDRSEAAKEGTEAIAEGECQMMRLQLLVFAVLVETAAVGAQEERAESRKATTARTETYLGVLVAQVPGILRTHLRGVLDEGHGLVVEEVLAESPAARAGLRRFDVLTSLGNKTVASRSALASIVGSAAGGRNVDVVIIREGKARVLRVQLGQRPVVSRRALPRVPSVAITRNSSFARAPSRDRIRTMTVSVARRQLVVGLTYLDAAGNECRCTLEGTKDEILEQLRSVSESVLADARQRLNEATSFDKKNSLFSLSLTAALDEQGDAIVRAALRRPTRLGTVESLDFDAPPTVDAILEHLQEVPIAIREAIAKSLRNADIPRIRVTVDRSL